MITKEKIERGFKDGVVRLAIDPNMESGTVCYIGPSWFYFGGLTAEDMNPDVYLKNVPMKDIIREIYDTLQSFSEDDDMVDEYLFYDALLDYETKASTPAEEKPREFFVDTPLGKLKVWAKHKTDDPEDFPGVYVDLVYKDGEEDICLACVEYESSKEGLYTCVYGNVKDDSPTHVIRHNTEDL